MSGLSRSGGIQAREMIGSYSMRAIGRRGAVALGCLMAIGCATRERVSSMQRRVDSLAATLTAVVRNLEAMPLNADRNRIGDTVTVSTIGVISAGDIHAPVVVVEFADFQCPFCRKHYFNTLPLVRSRYIATGKVRYVIRDLPLTSLHPLALDAAEAARCVAAQQPSLYWRFHDSVSQAQDHLSDSLLARLGREFGGGSSFARCWRSGQTRRSVEADASEAARAGLNSTPSFVVGLNKGADSVSGSIIRGAYPFDTFKALIDSLLKSSVAALPPNPGDSPASMRPLCGSTFCPEPKAVSTITPGGAK
jgi:protein-disulfide isomerase